MSNFWKSILTSLLPFLFKKTEQVVETHKLTVDDADAALIGETVGKITTEAVKKASKE